MTIFSRIGGGSSMIPTQTPAPTPSPSPVSTSPAPTPSPTPAPVSTSPTPSPEASTPSGVAFGNTGGGGSSSVAYSSSQPAWIPTGASTTTGSGYWNGGTTSYNLYAQQQTEARHAVMTDTGSMESTVFDGRPRTQETMRFKGVDANEYNQPSFALGQGKKGPQRTYFSLDAPGMTGDNTGGMNRHQVSGQYRQSYVAQQERKGMEGSIPATYHADVSLRQAQQIADGAIPQEGAKKIPGYQKMNQKSDSEKYASSYGLTPDSFNQLNGTTHPGSQRIATASHSGRNELSGYYDPNTVVHPTALTTPAEQMLQRHQAFLDGINGGNNNR